MDHISNLDELFSRLSSKIDDSKAELSSQMVALKEEIRDEIREELGAIKQSQEVLQAAVGAVETKLEKHDSELLRMDREIRKNNIVVFGLKFDESVHDDIINYVLGELNDKMDLNLVEADVMEVVKLGQASGAPLKVVLANVKIKKLILNKKKRFGWYNHIYP